jgi:hypothetical protein
VSTNFTIQAGDDDESNGSMDFCQYDGLLFKGE